MTLQYRISSDKSERTDKVVREVRGRYRTLFTSDLLTGGSRPALETAFKEGGAGLCGRSKKYLDPSHKAVRGCLKEYFDMPLPDELLCLLESFEGKMRRWFRRYHQLMRLDRTLKLSDLLDRGPPYPLDLLQHVKWMIEPFGHSNEALDLTDFPIFGTRLLALKEHLDSHKPRTFKQLIRDRRDTVGYVTFWAVIAVGLISIVLALVSIAISTAQTVAAFEALPGP